MSRRGIFSKTHLSLSLASAPAFYSRWPYWLRVNELEHARGARIKTGDNDSMELMAACSERTRGELMSVLTANDFDQVSTAGMVAAAETRRTVMAECTPFFFCPLSGWENWMHVSCVAAGCLRAVAALCYASPVALREGG